MTETGINLVFQMMDSLRNSPLIREESAEVSLMILIWAKLSSIQMIPMEARFDPSFAGEPKLVSHVLKQLGEAENPNLRVIAKGLARLNPATLQPAFDLAQRATESGVLQGFGVKDVLAAAVLWGRQAYANFEVATLMSRLADIRSEDTVYVGWDLGAGIPIEATKEGASVYLETPTHSPIPSLISLVADRPFEIRYGDPIQSPSAIEGGKPRKFDVAISMPPFGSRYGAEVAQRDWFGRFPEPTTSGTVLAVRQALSQASRRVVITVLNNLLFSTGAELALRKDLVARGIVEAVIAMPSGLLRGTNISFALLVLDPSGGHEHIRFINAESSRFWDASEQLINIDDLIDLFSDTSTTHDAITVSTADVLRNDAQLQVNRYLLSDTKKRIQAILADHASVQLGKIVSTVRPMPTTSREEDSIVAMEIAAADIPFVGYIRKPGRTVMVGRQEAEKNEQQFLRPFDIVLIVKGSVGKLGIVPAAVPPPGAAGWVAGQSAIVLRSIAQDKIDPRTLAVQLRSAFGQELLKSIVSGATIPLIQLRELLRLEVLLPPLATARQAGEALDREEELQNEIDRLREAQSKVAENLWPL